MTPEPTGDQLKKQNEDWIARAMMGEESLIGSLRMVLWGAAGVLVFGGFFAWLLG